jgi:hypothetical protein
MKLQQRDKRALVLLGVAAVIAIALRLFVTSGGETAVVEPANSIAAAEARLARVRGFASRLPGDEQLLKRVSAELAGREKGVLQADTTAQAQAQLIDVLRRVVKDEAPAVEFGGVEMGETTKLGDDYGETRITAPITCHIEELLNIMAGLSRQPEAVAMAELRVAGTDPKKKTMNVRLTVSAVVPGRLVPEKKGAVLF